MLRSTIGVAALVIGCGSVTDSRTHSPDGGTASAMGGNTGSRGSGATGGNTTPSGGAIGGGAFTICGNQTYDTGAASVDMLVLVERAGSMTEIVPAGGTRWAALQEAIGSFIGSPAVSVVNAGIQYFPLGGDAGTPCTAAYDVPDVELAPLSSNAVVMAASLQAQTPSGLRATGPALAGALTHMKAWSVAHPDRTPVVVLVTDGSPAQCEPRRATDLESLAHDAFATAPGVRTFVVGLGPGINRTELDAIAKAGGTTRSFVIDDRDIVNQAPQVLRSVADTPLTCDFDLPRPEDPAAPLNHSTLAVAYAPFATQSLELLEARNAASDCAGDDAQGWYFDDAQAPTKAVLCPGTCARLAAGRIELLLRCQAP